MSLGRIAQPWWALLSALSSFVTLFTWLRWCLLGFSTSKVIIFLFLIVKYLGREGTFPEAKVVPSPCLFVCLYQHATWIFISVLLLLCILLLKLPQLGPVGIQVASCAFRQVSISNSPPPCTASFLNFLTPWDYPSASYIFTAPALGSTSFPKSLGSFHWG